MTKILFTIIFILLTCMPVSAYTARVIKVIDGDTIKIIHKGKTFNVRLYGIDAPELKQPYGERAKDFVKRFIGERTVEITEYGKDKYNRVLAVVKINYIDSLDKFLYPNRSLNEMLLKIGLAWIYSQYCEKPFCYRRWAKIEAYGQDNLMGIWKGDQMILPPWLWREQQKKGKQK